MGKWEGEGGNVREAVGRERGCALPSKLRLTTESSFSSVNVCVASSKMSTQSHSFAGFSSPLNTTTSLF